MFKPYISFDLRHFRHICPVRDRRLGIQDLKDPLRSGNVGHKLIVKVAQVVDRLPEHIDVCPKREKGTECHMFCPEDHDPYKIQADTADSPRQVNDRAKRVT